MVLRQAERRPESLVAVISISLAVIYWIAVLVELAGNL